MAYVSAGKRRRLGAAARARSRRGLGQPVSAARFRARHETAAGPPGPAARAVHGAVALPGAGGGQRSRRELPRASRVLHPRPRRRSCAGPCGAPCAARRASSPAASFRAARSCAPTRTWTPTRWWRCRTPRPRRSGPCPAESAAAAVAARFGIAAPVRALGGRPAAAQEPGRPDRRLRRTAARLPATAAPPGAGRQGHLVFAARARGGARFGRGRPHPLHRLRRRTTTCCSSTTPATCSCSRPSTRASGCRCWRPWRAGARWPARILPPCRRWPTARRSCSTPASADEDGPRHGGSAARLRAARAHGAAGVAARRALQLAAHGPAHAGDLPRGGGAGAAQPRSPAPASASSTGIRVSAAPPSWHAAALPSLARAGRRFPRR